jgi:hypothetical protein
MKDWTQRTRLWIYLLIALIPILGLLLLGINFVRDNIVIPFEYDLWLAGLAIRVIPQAILWGILCCVVLVLALRSLVAGKNPPQKVEREEKMRTRSERVAFWTLQIRMRARGSYSRLRFADFFSKLILDILTYTGEVSQEQYEKALKTGLLDLPPEVQTFLKARLTPFYELRSPPFFQRLMGSIRRLLVSPAQRSIQPESIKPTVSKGPALDQELESVVTYLEHELEVNSNHHGD